MTNKTETAATKRCYKCRNDLPLFAFSFNASHKDGLNSECRECMRDYRSAYRDRNTARNKFPLSTTNGDAARAEVVALRAELAAIQKAKLDDRVVRESIIGLTQSKVAPPKWLAEPRKNRGGPGVPTLFLSDWHWGEVVDPPQIGGVNAFDLSIARERARFTVTGVIDLLSKHVVKPQYPGLVLAVGGDMFSGDIHEELLATNESEIGPLFVDLFGVMSWVIETLVEQYGRLFIPWVAGNHGRMTRKPRMKGVAYTNFDWLLGSMLEKHFEKDKRISFLVAPGTDAHYSVYGHRYCLTHGDRLGKGGDGIIGALGPILRGDAKKRARASQVDADYDTLLCGHFHQLMMLRKVVVNGSLKGYDEYANSENLAFERPQQALWLTHPEHGMTISMPVFSEPGVPMPQTTWVSWVETK